MKLLPAAAAALMLVQGAWAQAPDSPRHNVLFIAVDDMRTDLGCYGSDVARSPNIDRLAREGVLFERAYAQQALCGPSRASLLTGYRPQTLGINDLHTHIRVRRPEVVTLPQAFMASGYTSIGHGKVFHNGHQIGWHGDEASWSVPAQYAQGSHYEDIAQVDGELPPNLSSTAKTEIRDVPDEAYFDGRIAQLGIEAMRASRDEPFFIAVGFWKPHLPFNPPKKYWDMHDPGSIELAAHRTMPAGAPEIAWHNGNEMLRDFPDGISDDDARTLRRGYQASISYVDAQIGKLLDELDELGLRDETIVVLWSDHGFHLGEHGLWAKTSDYELDARVPLIISAPGMARGETASAPVELLDLYPTLLDLCGIPVPEDIEGVSLRPIMEAPRASVKPHAFTETTRPSYPKRGVPAEVMGYSLTDGRYRYTEWREVASGDLVGVELYDHEKDAPETVNLVGAEPQVARRLGKALAEQFGIVEGEPLMYMPPPPASVLAPTAGGGN